MSSDPESASIRAAVTAPVLGEMRYPAMVGASRLDGFARAAGPDVAVVVGAMIVRMYAVFDVDPQSRNLSVRVVDEAGRLVRMIPSDSVSKMLNEMARYRR